MRHKEDIDECSEKMQKYSDEYSLKLKEITDSTKDNFTKANEIQFLF